MSKKIIISESQYKRVFLNEQGWSNYNNRGSVDESEKSTNVSNSLQHYYRLWANSTPELSKKYGKESEYDLDAIRKDPTSGTFNKSYSQGKDSFDKDWLIVPDRYSYPQDRGRLLTDGGKSLFFTKGGKIIYKVNTKKVLPEKLTDQDGFANVYSGGRYEPIYDGETYGGEKGSKIIEKIKNIYSSSNTKKATAEIEQEKKEDKEKLDAEIKLIKDSLKNDWGFTSDVIGGYLSRNHVFAQTVLNAMKKLNDLTKSKVNSGVKGKYDVCVKGFGTCNVAAGGQLYVANDFEDLSNNINYRTDIGGYPASYVVDITTVEFHIGNLQRELDTAFKYDKNAYKSKSFPNGWFNFFTSYYGGNYSKVYKGIRGIGPYEIKDNKETLNQYEKGTTIWSILGDCFSDYRCVLEVASIAALAVPGVGMMLSAGIDFVNSGLYGVEALNAKTDEERTAALIAGGLTLIGGFAGGGVGQTRRLLTKGSRNPKIYNYVDDVMKTISKELPEVKNLSKVAKEEKIVKIYSNTAEKYGLSNSDVLVAHDILKDFSKIDPKIAAEYTKVLNSITGRLSKVQRANLTKVASDSKFQKVVEENGGDVIKGLNKYMKTKAGREALIEGGIFITLTEVMEIPVVQQWVATKIIDLKAKVNPTVKNIVQSEGYDWGAVKEIFNSDSSGKDNSLLKKAWEKGWRPWPKGEEPTEMNVFETGILWLIENPKYQTETFKNNFSQIGIDDVKREVKPEKEGDRREGVIYYDTKEELEQRSKIDDNITDEEIETTSDILDQYF